MSEASHPHSHSHGFQPPGAAEVVVPQTFELLPEFVSPRVRINTRFAIIYPLSTRRYAVQEDSAVFASGPDEHPIMQWLIERVGVSTGRGTRRYVLVLDLGRHLAWRSGYAEAIEFLHDVNP
jgi:hypothetical protein